MWEPAIAAALADPALLEPRRKLPLLEQDLAALGALPRTPPHAPPYPFASEAEALGALYVLEGSTLGGLLIAAHVRRELGHVSAFHGSYGKATATMWHALREALERRLDAGSLDLAVTAADRTFATLRRHLAA